MRVLNSSSYVKNGHLHYIVTVSFECDIVHSTADQVCILDGTEVIVHNGAIHTSGGGTGIPAVQDTNFYTAYQ